MQCISSTIRSLLAILTELQLIHFLDMPKSKARDILRSSIELQCEFSECHDKCNGVEELCSHVSLHIEIMRQQLSDAANNSNNDVDKTRCECPWRDCQAVLEIEKDWPQCLRHIKFHAYHTYLKIIGADELRRRKIAISCTNTATRNTLPELPDAFQCGWEDCQFVDESAYAFYRHVESHAKAMVVPRGGVRQCQWSKCDYTTKAAVTKLSDHLRIHSQERRLACPVCGNMYSQSTRLEDHQKRQHRGVGNFQCSHCNKKCSTERLLRDHLRKHVNLYSCMFCDMTCVSPSALRIHILYRHSAERPFSCPDCDSTFKTKYALANHSLCHEYEGMDLVCAVENCGFKSKNADSMKRHNSEVHKDPGRVFGCHLCEAMFQTGPELSNHLKGTHELNYPSGHVRFRFAPEADGIRRLVTVRYECFQVGIVPCRIVLSVM